jgi:hypothetical protein
MRGNMAKLLELLQSCTSRAGLAGGQPVLVTAGPAGQLVARLSRCERQRWRRLVDRTLRGDFVGGRRMSPKVTPRSPARVSPQQRS